MNGPKREQRPRMDCRVIGERSDAVLQTAMPGNDELNPSRDASRIRVFVQAVRKPFHAPPEGRQSAERRNARAVPCKARPRPQRGPLAFRRSTAALASNPQETGSAPGHASWDLAKRVDHKTTTRQFVKLAGVTPPSPVPVQRCTSRTGRSAGVCDARSRPGTVCETVRGDRTCSTFRIASGMCPSMSGFATYGTANRTCQGLNSAIPEPLGTGLDTTCEF